MYITEVYVITVADIVSLVNVIIEEVHVNIVVSVIKAGTVLNYVD